MLSPVLHFRGDNIKKSKIISLILSLSVLMSVVIFPIQTYAYDDWVTTKYINSFSFCDSRTCYTGFDGALEQGGYNIPKAFTRDTYQTTKNSLKNIQFYFEIQKANELHDGDTFEFQFTIYEKSRYLSFGGVEVGFDGSTHVKATDVSFNNSTGLIKGKVICNNDTKAGEKVFIYLNNPVVDITHDNFYFKLDKIRTRSISKQDSERTTFFDNVKKWFNTVFEWLKDIRDNLTNGFSNIGSWLTSLGDRISNFFTTLSNNIKGFFTDLSNNIKIWFDNLVKDLKDLNAKVGQWFKDLTNSIGEFFTKLFNRLWWGNEDGEAAYQPPTINNKLNDILAILNDYRIKLNDTITNIDSSAVAVSDYISNGTALVNGVINVAGAGFTALITFGIVFVLVRKVVGR